MAGVAKPGRVSRAAKTKPAAAAPAAAAPADAAAPVAPTSVPTQEAEPVASATAGKVLEVRGPLLGRRRAGYAFDAEAKRIPLSDLTDDQVDAIENDPELMARIVPADPA